MKVQMETSMRTIRHVVVELNDTDVKRLNKDLGKIIGNAEENEFAKTYPMLYKLYAEIN